MNSSRPFQLLCGHVGTFVAPLSLSTQAQKHTHPALAQPGPGLLETQIHSLPVPALPGISVTVPTAHTCFSSYKLVLICAKEQEERKLNQSRPHPAPAAAHLVGGRAAQGAEGSRRAECLLQGAASASLMPKGTCRLSARSTKGQSGGQGPAGLCLPAFPPAVLSFQRPIPALGAGAADAQLPPQLQTQLLENTNGTNSSQTHKTSGRKLQLRAAGIFP